MVLAGEDAPQAPALVFSLAGDARHFLATKEPVNRESPSAADQQRHSH
jgi:hypothetical protein